MSERSIDKLLETYPVIPTMPGTTGYQRIIGRRVGLMDSDRIVEDLAEEGYEVVESDVAKLGRAVQATEYTTGSKADIIVGIIYAEAGVERPS